jgi:hypothetical protein
MWCLDLYPARLFHLYSNSSDDSKQCSVVVRVLQKFAEMFWVFSIGSQELKTNLLPILERDNKASFDISLDKITPIKSSVTKQDLEFTEMEAAIHTSQALCSWIEEEKIFLCWGTKVRDNVPVNELTILQNQLFWMKALLANIKSGKD